MEFRYIILILLNIICYIETIEHTTSLPLLTGQQAIGNEQNLFIFGGYDHTSGKLNNKMYKWNLTHGASEFSEDIWNRTLPTGTMSSWIDGGNCSTSGEKLGDDVLNSLHVKYEFETRLKDQNLDVMKEYRQLFYVEPFDIAVSRNLIKMHYGDYYLVLWGNNNENRISGMDIFTDWSSWKIILGEGWGRIYVNNNLTLAFETDRNFALDVPKFEEDWFEYRNVLHTPLKPACAVGLIGFGNQTELQFYQASLIGGSKTLFNYYRERQISGSKFFWGNINSGSLVSIGTDLYLFGGLFNDNQVSSYIVKFSRSSFSLENRLQGNTQSSSFSAFEARYSLETTEYERYYHAACTIGTSFWVYGGRNEDGTVVNTLFEYKTEQNLFLEVSIEGDAPSVYGHTMSSVDNVILIAGGRDGEGVYRGVYIINTLPLVPEITLINSIALRQLIFHSAVNYFDKPSGCNRGFLIGGSESSNAISELTISRPAITQVEGCLYITNLGTHCLRGDMITILGIFPENPSLTLTFGGEDITNSITVRQNQLITFPVPMTSSGDVDIVVTMCGVSATYGVVASFIELENEVELDGTNYTGEVLLTSASGGDQIKVYGNFGVCTNPKVHLVYNFQSIDIRNSSCNINSVENTVINCTIGAGTGGGYNIVVACNEGLSEASSYKLSYPGPVITQIYLNDILQSGPIVGDGVIGDILEFRGSNFNIEEDKEFTSVMIGSQICDVISTTTNIIKCLTRGPASGNTNNLQITLGVGNQVVTAVFDFTYPPVPIFKRILEHPDPEQSYPCEWNATVGTKLTNCAVDFYFELVFEFEYAGTWDNFVVEFMGRVMKIEEMDPVQKVCRIIFDGDGTGLNKNLVLVAVKDGNVFVSDPYPILDFAGPQILRVDYISQAGVPSNSNPDIPYSPDVEFYNEIPSEDLPIDILVQGANFGDDSRILLDNTECLKIDEYDQLWTITNIPGHWAEWRYVETYRVIRCRPDIARGSSAKISVVQASGLQSAQSPRLTIPACSAGTFLRSGECAKCPEGTYSGGSNAPCVECSAGTISTVSRIVCENCRAGTSSSEGSNFCFNCTGDGISSEAGDSRCSGCPGGKYRNATVHTECVDCLEGTASSGGKVSCDPCKPGSIASNQGQSICIPCSPGFYSNQTSHTCSPCAQGEKQNGNSCKACAEGKFYSSGACIKCERGEYAVGLRNIQCQSCGKGTYGNELGQSGCKLCSPGSITPEVGLTKCTQCAEGKYSNKAGSECLSCEPGTYSDKPGVTACTKCANSTYQLLPSQTRCQSCLPLQEYFLKVNGTGVSPCRKCPDGAICDGIAVKAKKGFWLYPPSEPEYAYGCPVGFCKGTQCDTTRRNTDDNILCGECIAEHYQWGNTCAPCKDNKTNTGLLLGYIFIGFVFVGGFHILVQGAKAELKIFMFFVQSAVVIIGPKLSEIGFLSIFDFNIFSAFAVCLAPWTSRSTIWLGVLLPLFCAVQLLVIMAILSGFWYIKHKCILKNVSKKKFHKSPYLKTLAAIFMYSYNGISKTVFSFTACKSLSGDISVIQQHPSISCKSGYYAGMVSIAIIIIIAYVFALPMGIFAVLFKKRKSDKSFSKDTKFNSRYGSFYEPYHDQYWYWEFYSIGRRLVLILVNVFIYDYQLQSSLSAVLLLVFLLIHIHVKPFTRKGENLAEGASLAILLVTAMFLCTTELPITGGLVAFYTLLVVLPTVVFLGYVVRKRVYQFKKQKRNNSKLEVDDDMDL